MMTAVGFGEPSWDMILELYVAECAGQSLDVTGLCATTGVPRTTSLRHLASLATVGLVERAIDPADSRRIFVRPRDSLRHQLERWLDAEIAARAIGNLE